MFQMPQENEILFPDASRKWNALNFSQYSVSWDSILGNEKHVEVSEESYQQIFLTFGRV